MLAPAKVNPIDHAFDAVLAPAAVRRAADANATADFTSLLMSKATPSRLRRSGVIGSSGRSEVAP
jgi:hypothetical protein